MRMCTSSMVVLATFLCFCVPTPMCAQARQVRWEVGSAEGPVAFEDIVDATFGPDGDIFVLDWGSARVWRFSSSGDVLGATGHKGGGPGEFLRPLHLGFLADTLWVSDPSQERTTYFWPFGHVLATERLALPQLKEPLSVASPTYVSSPGWAVLKAGVSSRLLVRGSPFSVPLLAVARTSRQTATLANLEIGTQVISSLDPGRPWSGYFLANPLGHQDRWAGRPGGGVVAWATSKAAGEVWIVRVFLTKPPESAGKPIATLHLPRRRPSESDLAPLITEFAQGLIPHHETKKAAAERRAREVVTATVDWMPAYTDLLVGADSSVWLRTSPEAGESLVRWVRVDPTGATEQVAMPDDLHILAISGCCAVYRRKDTLDVPHVGVIELPQRKIPDLLHPRHRNP
jgi:hypothetical protein